MSSKLARFRANGIAILKRTRFPFCVEHFTFWCIEIYVKIFLASNQLDCAYTVQIIAERQFLIHFTVLFPGFPFHS